MKIIVPSVELMKTGTETDFMTPEQFIEKVGRTCYKSEDKITEDSAAKFVTALIKRGHEAMLEHWSLIFKTEVMWYEQIVEDWEMLLHNGNIPLYGRLRPYLRFTDLTGKDGKSRCIISGNMRALRDFIGACVEGFGFVPGYMHSIVKDYPLFFPEYQEWISAELCDIPLTPITINDLEGKIEHDVHHDVTVKFICDRGVSHEAVRHRTSSFAQESTRYCNYGLDKFGNEITVIRPSWCKSDSDIYREWELSCMRAEGDYFLLLSMGATPQEARSVLPSSLKTELVMTTNLAGWDHFIFLRNAKDAQPDMREIAWMTNNLFERKVYREEND